MVRKAFVTSIGEVTTDLCVWALKRNGFEVKLVYDEKTTLAQKLQDIYNRATDDFIRVDADVVVNKNCKPTMETFNWWTQYLTYDWFKQDVTHGGVQVIKKEALPILRKHIQEFMNIDRPETMISRVAEFHNPRRMTSAPVIMGIQNYKGDVGRVKTTKMQRKYYDLYDWELAGRLEQL